MSKPKSFTIDRSKWSTVEVHDRLRRVERPDEAISQLLDGYGRMCCLGFYALACGLKKDDIQGVSSPGTLYDNPTKRQIVGMVNANGENTKLAGALMDANDGIHGEPAPKRTEQTIRSLFKKIGVAVRFTGDYPRPRRLKEKKKK